MVTQTLTPESPEERLIWWAITAIYPLYFAGALYIVGPVVGWVLLFMVLARKARQWQGLQPRTRIPWAIRLWILGMLVMLLSLVMGHLDYRLGSAQLIKSSIGWAKGWALLAIFPLAGTLRIRPALLYRACMVVCRHTLWMAPLFMAAWLLRLPETPYVSPLKIVGGPGPEFFALSLYEIDPQSGMPRWRLFTPWAPALGFMATIFFVFALAEKESYWRRIGIAASILMVLMSQSRLGAVSLLAVAGAWLLISRFSVPLCAFFVALGAYLFAFIGPVLVDGVMQFTAALKAARADSTRVRETLARIALERWQNEAPLWGHATVERGPHLVEYMPIGSHHTWYGLLFVKGAVGAVALALPMVFSALVLLSHLRPTGASRPALCCLGLLALYTLGENLEILAYLIWPALLCLGMAHNESCSGEIIATPALTTVTKGDASHV